MDIAGLGAELRQLPEVRLAWCFGSQARGEARGDSDVDVAVLVDAEALDRRGEVATIRRLAGRLGRRVPSTRLDLVLLNDASPLLRHRVLRDGQLLLARSEEERVRFVRQTLREVQDFAPRRAMHTRARVRRLKEGSTDGGSGDLLAQARRAAQALGQARRLP
jgi:uncharacterized protein